MSKNYNSHIQTNNTDLQAILNTINELPEAGEVKPNLQDKTVTPTTDEQTIKADTGYDGLDIVTVEAIPVVEQAKAIITVQNNGLISADVAQSEGYTTGGIVKTTYQLPTQGATTITPTTDTQTVVKSGKYTTGDIVVEAIPSDYIVPSGTKTIAANGTYDVKSYASATVNVTGEDVTDETNDYTNKLATLEIAITALETELESKTSGESNIETCNVTLISNNNEYSTIVIFQYTSIDSGGQIVEKTLVGSSITEPVTIQCVCNTGISGLFPPTNNNLITLINIENKGCINSSSGTICWLHITASAGEEAAIYFD